MRHDTGESAPGEEARHRRSRPGPAYPLVPLLEADWTLLHAPRGWERTDVLDLDGVCGFLSQEQQTKLKG